MHYQEMQFELLPFLAGELVIHWWLRCEGSGKWFVMR